MSFLKRETPHNPYGYAGLLLSYYTIPRNNRELQLVCYASCRIALLYHTKK